MSDTSNKRCNLSDLTTYISNVSNLQERVVLHIIRIKVNLKFLKKMLSVALSLITVLWESESIRLAKKCMLLSK